jgi:hypothetical protein
MQWVTQPLGAVETGRSERCPHRSMVASVSPTQGSPMAISPEYRGFTEAGRAVAGAADAPSDPQFLRAGLPLPCGSDPLLGADTRALGPSARTGVLTHDFG